jgi:hypothetical protein
VAELRSDSGCDRKIGPYLCCSVVQGDCLELMKALPDGCVDAVITDPPYGIKYSPTYSGVMRGAYPVHAKNYPPIVGDDTEFDPLPFLRFPCLLWGANHYAHTLPHNGRWLVWDKRCGIIPERTQSDCEMAWCSDYGAARMFRHVWDGMVKDSERGIPRQHPTQKPEELMGWCLGYFPKAQTILDPFCGSGTTLVAAKKLGRHFLGFEISPDYVAIARDRLARIDAQPSLFQPKPEISSQS